MVVERWKNIGLFLLFTGIPTISVHFFDTKHEPIVLLPAVLIGVTAYYAWITHWQLEHARKSTIVSIRPYILATRLSKQGEIGIYAGEDGKNRTINLINVGSGHAHRVNIRIFPPAEAFARDTNGQEEVEQAIFVIQGVELPRNSKRMWNNGVALCTEGRWHLMYAEYEDTEGNGYYTIQSGYNIKTGKIQELKQGIRKSDDDPLWVNIEDKNWLEKIDAQLKSWAQQQEALFNKRTNNTGAGRQEKTNSEDNSREENSAEIKFDEFIWPWFTPRWFEFLTWVLMIALFLGLFKKTKNIFAFTVYSVSNTFLIFYLCAKLNKFLFNIKPFLHTKRSKFIFVCITSFILILGINFFLNKIIDQLVIHVNQ
jgi:hypothetical protein